MFCSSVMKPLVSAGLPFCDVCNHWSPKSGSTSTCVLTQSCPTLFATPWTVARQALLSMGFSRQEYWTGLSFLPPGDLPDPGNRTHVSCLLRLRRILYHQATRASHSITSSLFIRCRSLRKILRGIASPLERFSPLSLYKAARGRFFQSCIPARGGAG